MKLEGSGAYLMYVPLGILFAGQFILFSFLSVDASKLYSAFAIRSR